ncbi:MAG: hypothetical protein AAFQ94_30740 [Bacteroidota bacterium]
MKRLNLPLYLLIMLLIYACNEPPEVLDKDISVADVKEAFASLRGSSNGRQDTVGIDWDNARYKEISVGDALVFPLENVSSTYVSSEDNPTLYPLKNQGYAFAYKNEDETVALEYVQAIPTADTEAFTGVVTVSDWNGESKHAFFYENGTLVTPESNGRTQETVCTETFTFNCKASYRGDELLYAFCTFAGTTTECITTDGPTGIAPDDYDEPRGGSSSGNLCPHPEIEGHFVPCEQYDCPGGFEIVEGFEERGCQPVCGIGQQRDEFGFCFDDKDCNVTSDSIKEAFPEIDEEDADTLAALINAYGKEFGINNVSKLHHFLGQSNHELGGFRNLNKEEDTYYSPNRLIAVFPSRFSTTGEEDGKEKASDYAYNSVKMANYAYANKNGNGNEASGDGYKFRGRGLFQLTGKDNYEDFNTFYNNRFLTDISFTSNPSLVASNTEISVISALWYYREVVLKNINVNSNTTVDDVTEYINVAKLEIDKRENKTNQAKNNIANCIEFNVN